MNVEWGPGAYREERFTELMGVIDDGNEEGVLVDNYIPEEP